MDVEYKISGKTTYNIRFIDFHQAHKIPNQKFCSFVFVFIGIREAVNMIEVQFMYTNVFFFNVPFSDLMALDSSSFVMKLFHSLVSIITCRTRQQTQ